MNCRWRAGPRWVAGLAVGTIGLTGGCATYSDRTEAARQALARGQLDEGQAQLNKILKVRHSEDLPSKWKKNFALVVLERAMVLQAAANYELSARDFQVADKELEFLDIARDSAGKIGKYIYSDSATKYKTSPTEKLALNAMNMCNYLATGKLDGARIEAKRFTVMRKYLGDYDPEREHGAFGSYLAGFVYERLGNANEALRYYEEALQDRDFASLQLVIPRLASKGSYRGSRIKNYLPAEPTRPSPPPPARPAAEEPPASVVAPPQAGTDAPPVQKPSVAAGEIGFVASASESSLGPSGAQVPGGELLVVAKVGRVPHKEPRRIPIGAAVGLAGAFVTGDTTLLEYGMFKVVTYPELVASQTLFETAAITIDGQAVVMDLATDFANEIVVEYEAIKPKIIGSALTRMIARAAVAEGARAAGRQSEGAGGLIGFLAAAAVEGTLVALDKPDTRSWSTLPARVYVGRALLPAGKHRVVVTVSGRGGRETHTIDTDVPAGGFVVLDVTTLR